MSDGPGGSQPGDRNSSSSASKEKDERLVSVTLGMSSITFLSLGTKMSRGDKKRIDKPPIKGKQVEEIRIY